MIAGLEEITGGEIRIGGKRVNDAAAEGARHRDGVPELRALSAHDGARQHGLRAAAGEDATRPTIDAQGQTRRRDPGARRRCSIAIRASSRAASASAWPWGAPSCAIPQVFLFDEPLSNLDAKLRVRDAQRDQGAAPAPEDHLDLRHPRPDRGDDHGRPDRRDARRPHRADGDGRSSSTTIPANLFVAGFIGSPAMNFLPATLRRGAAGARVELADGARVSRAAAMPAARTGSRWSSARAPSTCRSRSRPGHPVARGRGGAHRGGHPGRSPRSGDTEITAVFRERHEFRAGRCTIQLAAGPTSARTCSMQASGTSLRH